MTGSSSPNAISSCAAQANFWAKRQSGVPEFALADLAAHQDLLPLARETAGGMIGPDRQPINRDQCDLLLSLFERDSAVRFLASG